jgi:hypothetical protein
MRLLFCFLMVCAAIAQAQSAATLSALPPNHFAFTGSWACEGAFGNRQVHRSVFAGAEILGGKWIELTERDIEPATGYLAKYLIGYDPLQKQLVEFDANNFGAATYASEAGWQGQVLTMTSPVGPAIQRPYVANRFVYTIAGPDSFTVDWQIARTAALAWVGSDHLVCRRAKG